METFTKDGTGGGYLAEVTESNMLKTESVSIKEISYESQRHGDAFVLNSGFISLTTTGAFNAIMYVKNTDTENKALFIEKLRVCGGLCAGASTMQVLLEANPTGGTLISDQTPGLSASANISSSREFGGLVYIGGDGKTVSGGFQLSNFQGHAPGHSIQEYEGALILSKNDSISIKLNPSVAMDVCIEIVCYHK